MTFHVGQKVVCINDAWGVPLQVAKWVPNVPKRGVVYTVREILVGRDLGVDLRLIEVVNPTPPWDAEVRWNKENFRPVVEKKTDISIFTALLNPSPAKESERV